jgi:hypothetical protein
VWILFVKPPWPDAAYFPGRRLLATLDAIAWPTAWFIAVLAIPYSTGILGPAAKTLLILIALRRVSRAVLRNERYRFTTVRWALPILGLVALAGIQSALRSMPIAVHEVLRFL